MHCNLQEGLGLGDELCQAPEILMIAALEGTAAQAHSILQILRLKLLHHIMNTADVETGQE